MHYEPPSRFCRFALKALPQSATHLCTRTERCPSSLLDWEGLTRTCRAETATAPSSEPSHPATTEDWKGTSTSIELDLARRGFGEIFGYGGDGGLANSAAGLV